MVSSARIDELRKKFDENPRRYFAPLANEYRKAGDLEQAVFICQEYLPQQPGHMSGHIVYGQTLFEIGRHDEAKLVFETALSLDPENLIALRHLGDISHQTGDLTAARNWYQRVLEADPRNDEIAQLMISLLAAPDPPPHSINAPALTPPSTSAVDRWTAPVADDAGAAVDDLEFENSAGVKLRPSLPSVKGEQMEPLSALPLSPQQSAGKFADLTDAEDLLDLNDFNLGDALPSVVDGRTGDRAPPDSPFAEYPSVGRFPGAELAADRSAGQGPFDDAPANANFTADTTAAHAATTRDERPEERGFELGTEDGLFESDPYAIAAGSGAPPLGLAPDKSLGLIPDEQPSESQTGIDGDGEFVVGLETFEPAENRANPGDAALPETEGSADSLPVGSSSIEGAGTADEGAEFTASSDEAFVTETMAELYLRQGHLDSAADIYRKLVSHHPEDVQLRDRLRAVEEQTYGKPPEQMTPAEPALAPVYGGPTIREFLARLISHHTQVVVETVPTTDTLEDAVTPSLVEAKHPFPSAHELTRIMPELDHRTPSSSETVRGSIDALFTGADASPSDVGAANTLHDAFAHDEPEPAPLRGTPAHRASNELSLDHVFKVTSPPRSHGDDFSFDQFFADDLAEGMPTPAGDSSATPSEHSDDVAQFNAWLNGLKKT